EGPEGPRLARLAEAEGVAPFIRFTGRVDNAAMAGLYREARICLNPSRADNMPISILEAWAAGVPVVSTRVGGVPYLVEEGETGLLCPPDDPEAMASAVARLHRDAGLYRRLREAGVARARDFAWPAVRGRLAAVYAELCGEW
ncbi:MAG: glycosyltransferase, partial [Nitrospirae bacterium]